MHPSSFPSLGPFGWDDRWEARFSEVTDSDARPGRVLRHDSTHVVVALPEGTEQLPVRAMSERPVVGDWVVVAEGAVASVLPRSSLLRRRDAGADIEQALAANVDLVLIVCGLDRPVKAGRVQRFVTLARDAGAVPVVVLSKADVVDDPTGAVATLAVDIPDIEICTLSSIEGGGLDDLHAVVRDRTVVLVGESGAGKSTLVNALVGDEVADTGEVRTGDSKGRHTTTSRQLHVLPGGGVLVDSPGIRSVGLWVDTEAVSAAFPEIEVIGEQCRFNDCGHTGEPGCAVAAAIEEGELTPRRYDAWLAMRREAEAAERSDHERRRVGRQFSRLAKDAQRRKGKR